MRVHGTLHNNMIRDRIVVRIKSSSLSKRMQLDDVLTSEKATKPEMRRLPNERSLEALKTGRRVYRTRPQVLYQRTPPKKPIYRPNENVCTRYGNLLLVGETCALQETLSATMWKNRRLSDHM